ncbi:MAG: tRNA pseudouridine(55) synthase TruB [Bacteroidota bacterium]
MLLTQDTIYKIDEWLGAAPETGATALIDKPSGWTSFDVVAKLRNAFRIKKVGHAGTLDPLATGLLILCFGRATKTIDQFAGMNKKYSGTIRLGATTKTLDAEAPEENIRPLGDIDEKDIRTAIDKFTGDIEQIPPMYSAKKVKGRKLYQLARKDREIERKPHPVTIYNIDVVKIDLPFVEIDVLCSKGTYIRTLADDIGRELGTGGYLSALRRTAIGEYTVAQALTIDRIIEQLEKIRN